MFNPSQQQQKQLKQDQIKILSGTLLALVLVVWGTWSTMSSHYLPKQSQNSQRIEELQSLISTHPNLVSELKTAKASFSEWETRAKSKLRTLQPTADEARFMTLMGELAATHQLDLQRFQPGNTAEYEKTPCLNISMVLSGSSPQIYRFLLALHQHERLLRIDSTELARTSEEVCQLKLSIKLFYLPSHRKPELVAVKENTNGGL